jgi:hypothetical protein
MNNTAFPKFEDLMDKIRADQELNEVPEEVMAEMEVRTNWPKLSSEVREKIKNGLPF